MERQILTRAVSGQHARLFEEFRIFSKKSIFSNMTPRDLDLEGTSFKVGMPVPISNTNCHVKFGMDRTSG